MATSDVSIAPQEAMLPGVLRWAEQMIGALVIFGERLCEIIFTPSWRKNDGGRADSEMQPFVVYMPGGSYIVTDNHHSLAAAAHAGPFSTEAEVWQNTLR